MYCIAFHIFFCNKKLSKYVNNFGKMLRCILAEKRKTTNGLHSDLNLLCFTQIEVCIYRADRQTREVLEEPRNELRSQLPGFDAVAFSCGEYTLVVLHVLRLVFGLVEALAIHVELLDVLGLVRCVCHFCSLKQRLLTAASSVVGDGRV
nr:hypothetical protein Iba_chr14eCG4170 [Ipomoea batatas]